MTTTWKPDPGDPTFELGWEGDTLTGERRRTTIPPVIDEPSSEQDEEKMLEGTSRSATASLTTVPRYQRFVEKLKSLPIWAKIAISFVAAGIVGVLVAANGITHVPSEKDYRNAFSDIARVNIDAGGGWAQPAEYPDPLTPEEQEIFEQVKPVFIDSWCEDLAEGESVWKTRVLAAGAVAETDGYPVELLLSMQRASAQAAAEHICPRYKGEAGKVTGYIAGLLISEQ